MPKSEEEDDYMSDSFLVETESTKPGLLARKMPPSVVKKLEKEQRIKELNEKHRKIYQPIKHVEKEKRDEKLNKALDSSNKGFAMLEKMGFKHGSGLGKHGTGRSEPVPLEIKSDRRGLGREAMIKKRKQMQESFLEQASKRRKKLEEQLQGDFKSRIKGKFMDKQIEIDVRRSQKACGQLDNAKNLEALKDWFWPKFKTSEEESKENEEEIDEPEDWEKLEELTEYLRSIHLYCTWCGTTFNDEEDLCSNCPGNSFESHND
eukprot:gene20364-22374_t